MKWYLSKDFKPAVEGFYLIQYIDEVMIAEYRLNHPEDNEPDDWLTLIERKIINYEFVTHFALIEPIPRDRTRESQIID